MDLLSHGQPRFALLCRDVYILSQSFDAPPGPRRGARWEIQITESLARRGFPVTGIPGGIQVFGVLPASGLRHQTDATIACADAFVIGEWKAYTGSVPKNEVLRFKAATDDLYDAMSDHPPRRPVLRLFGVAGDASPELRWYAARHGIALVERSRWPAPVLADPSLVWPDNDGPSTIDLRRLAWLSRPMQEVYPRLPDGSCRLPRRLPDPAVAALLAVQDRWSTRLWDTIDLYPGRFEAFAARLWDSVHEVL